MRDTASPASPLTRAQRWGPRRNPDGSIRFQLWGPAERSVGLRLNGSDVQMTNFGDGWHHVDVCAPPGSVYGFLLDDGALVGDPASRQQVGQLDGPSILTSDNSYHWRNDEWIGRPWEEAVIYEIHVGTFTPEGTFGAAIERLPRLAELGFTAVELMPIAHFPGTRGWGYDGVLQFAPHTAYGSPDDLKALIDAAHGLGLMVFLDVVYNHFGPEGNYLSRYAPQFFRTGRDTPWGPAIAYEQEPVRRYFIENALYWLIDFRLDGLRFDAIDQIEDSGGEHILLEIARAVRSEIGSRHVHLTTENPANGTDLMADLPEGRLYQADWNDDFHHALHVAVTGESAGYYEPFKRNTWAKLRQAMAHGYVKPGKAIIGDSSPPTESLPPTAFVHFLQNHDQVGNRARGDRLHATVDRHIYRALTEMLLLSPQVPLLFMGDDHLSLRPFHFFADYTGAIAKAIRDNRPKEAAIFGGVPEGMSASDLRDPNDHDTFVRSKIDWHEAATEDAIAWAEYVKLLLEIRRGTIVPLLSQATGYSGTVLADTPDRCVFIDWTFGSKVLQLRANFSRHAVALPATTGNRVYPTGDTRETGLAPASCQAFIRQS
ncbi:malto-oligosyltrehalose trehalohydrolase [Rhizobium herbae]|uniref:Malto-oligosyltrehalose trehalohydrolase n=1 Tax=Rhizobium herbae TaxID=508661 RepID=A0ABS7HBX1_9HYPH|nr:malto-oligosyltrehalose trehalohydrolase [Rhizobium herbae]MBW9064305.1 malto-oligosyltrehalose trehalohydrolase [Rhizobium herbae]